MNSENYMNRNISFTPKMNEQLKTLSDREERSVSATVRMAVKLYLQKKEKEYPDLL